MVTGDLIDEMFAILWTDFDKAPGNNKCQSGSDCLSKALPKRKSDVDEWRI